MDEDAEEEVFLPLRPVFGDTLSNRRERQIAEHMTRHREQGRQPGRRARGLTVADIVTAAVAVADDEGPEAVSMRRIARELNVGTMSLYWYVSSKEELHRLMLERVQAEAEVPEPSGDWQADLRSYAGTMRAALLRHPWAIDFLGSGPPSGPNDARNAERLMETLDGLGLDIARTMRVLMTFVTYVMGAALREIQEIRFQESVAEATVGMTEDEVGESIAEYGRRIRESGRYPHLAHLLDEDIDPDSPLTRDERFEFGLDCVLAGIAARLGL